MKGGLSGSRQMSGHSALQAWPRSRWEQPQCLQDIVLSAESSKEEAWEVSRGAQRLQNNKQIKIITFKSSFWLITKLFSSLWFQYCAKRNTNVLLWYKIIFLEWIWCDAHGGFFQAHKKHSSGLSEHSVNRVRESHGDFHSFTCSLFVSFLLCSVLKITNNEWSSKAQIIVSI